MAVLEELKQFENQQEEKLKRVEQESVKRVERAKKDSNTKIKQEEENMLKEKEELILKVAQKAKEDAKKTIEEYKKLEKKIELQYNKNSKIALERIFSDILK